MNSWRWTSSAYRVQFPKNMDANEYALKVQPAAKSLGIVLNKAAWLGKGKRPTVAVIEPVTEAKPEPAVKEEKLGNTATATVTLAARRGHDLKNHHSDEEFFL